MSTLLKIFANLACQIIKSFNLEDTDEPVSHQNKTHSKEADKLRDRECIKPRGASPQDKPAKVNTLVGRRSD